MRKNHLSSCLPLSILFLLLCFPAFGREITLSVPSAGSPFLGARDYYPTQTYVNLDPHLTRGYQALTHFDAQGAVRELRLAQKSSNPKVASEAAAYLGYVLAGAGRPTEARNPLQ